MAGAVDVLGKAHGRDVEVAHVPGFFQTVEHMRAGDVMVYLQALAPEATLNLHLLVRHLDQATNGRDLGRPR